MNKHFPNLFLRYPELEVLQEQLVNSLKLMMSAVLAGGKIMTCGNGGSAADAEHIVGELMKGFMLPRPIKPEQQKLLGSSLQYGPELVKNLQRGIPAISLVNGISLPTAFANDVNPELCFAQQVFVLGRPGDILFGISTSGNSANVNYALYVAQMMDIKTIGLTGRDGGEMANLCDVELRVPADVTPLIQELHLPIYHSLCAALEAALFSQ